MKIGVVRPIGSLLDLLLNPRALLSGESVGVGPSGSQMPKRARMLFRLLTSDFWRLVAKPPRAWPYCRGSEFRQRCLGKMQRSGLPDNAQWLSPNQAQI